MESKSRGKPIANQELLREGSEKQKDLRLVVFIPRNLHANLVLYHLASGITIREYVTELIKKDLKEKGYDPDTYPKIKISYDES